MASHSDSTDLVKLDAWPKWPFWFKLAFQLLNRELKADFVRANRALKNFYAGEVLSKLHRNVIHSMRDFGITVIGSSQESQESKRYAATLAENVCTECANLMRSFLGLSDQQLHCCLKQFGENRELVRTWARSKNDRRCDLDKEEDSFSVSDNSVWSALLGQYDGRRHWNKSFRCFACNDLTKHPEYKNSRPDWYNHYHSVLVLPLRYCSIDHGAIATGFLAFDSLNSNTFPDVPDIFDFCDDPGNYHVQLEQALCFQIAATMADVLSMFLRPFYDRLITDACQGGKVVGT